MNPQEVRATAYRMAAYFGAPMGVFWLVRFACETMTQQTADAWMMWSVFYTLLTFAVPFVAYYFGVQFQKKMQTETLRFGDYYSFTFFLFFFSSLILTLGQYVFYQWISPDFIEQMYQSLLTNLDVLIQTFPDFETYKTLLQDAQVPTPLQMSMQSIWLVSFAGIIIGLMNAFILNRKKTSIQP